MKDALGNDIIIGNAYGYSRKRDGFNTVRLGVVLGSTKTGFASLKINKTFTSVYDNQPEEHKNKHNEKVKVHSFILFPI